MVGCSVLGCGSRSEKHIEGLTFHKLGDCEEFFIIINKVSSPHYTLRYFFPLISVFDSAFASQYLLCLAFGNWLNGIAKWWFLEHRPYWWVLSTKYYASNNRPPIKQFSQTCETGPGSPSGHCCNMAIQLQLLIAWTKLVVAEQHCAVILWQIIVMSLCILLMLSTILARIFVAAHFPHQCLFGTLSGLLIARIICKYVSDPYIWQYGIHDYMLPSQAVKWHLSMALVTIGLSLLTYFNLKCCNVNFNWTVNMANRYCQNSRCVLTSTTPVSNMVRSTGYMVGWALAVDPDVTTYRYFTESRSLIIAAAIAVTIWCTMDAVKKFIKGYKNTNIQYYYTFSFLSYVIEPFMYLNLLRKMSMESNYSVILNNISLIRADFSMI